MKKGPFLILAIAAATSAAAQSRTHASPPSADSARMAGMADHAMSGPMTANMMKHMELTPARTATHDDTLRARKLVAELKRAIGKYQDTAAAVADGYHLFLPNAKEQHVYHFTNYGRAFKEVFRFNPAEPTSVLYQKTTDGTLELVGAMYTMPRAARPGALAQARELVPSSQRRAGALHRDVRRRAAKVWAGITDRDQSRVRRRARRLPSLAVRLDGARERGARRRPRVDLWRRTSPVATPSKRRRTDS
jgi:hypothetical protein